MPLLVSQLPHSLEQPLTHSLIIAALASVSILRSIAGFGFPIFAPGMFRSLGYGMGNTVLAVIAVVIGVPAYVSLFPLSLSSNLMTSSPILFWKFGERIRNASTYAVKTPPPMSKV